MTHRQKDPLRPLAAEEQTTLERLSPPTSQVARAKALLAVAAGQFCTTAAHAAGRRSGDVVAYLVTRFNQHGVAAIVPGHGGLPPTYTVTEPNRILTEACRTPDRERDGSATWSLMTLRHAFRTALDGLPTVSTGTIRAVLTMTPMERERVAGQTWMSETYHRGLKQFCGWNDARRTARVPNATISAGRSAPLGGWNTIASGLGRVGLKERWGLSVRHFDCACRKPAQF